MRILSKSIQCVVGLLLSVCVIPNAFASFENEKRVALVIGNSDYDIGQLYNAVNDSNLINTALIEVGFETVHIENATRREMMQAFDEFEQKLAQSDVGLFYYAGHAVQHQGENYLIPTDLDKLTPSNISWDTVEVGRMVDIMGLAKSSVKIMILDSCRNNPFRSFNRGTSRGLAGLNSSAKGMFIAYSTAPGSVAADGYGSNSPYTAALSKYLLEPGLSIHEVFSSVRADVLDETDNEQTPWENSSLLGNFYFTDKQNVTNTRASSNSSGKENRLAPKENQSTEQDPTTNITNSFKDSASSQESREKQRIEALNKQRLNQSWLEQVDIAKTRADKARMKALEEEKNREQLEQSWREQVELAQDREENARREKLEALEQARIRELNNALLVCESNMESRPTIPDALKCYQDVLKRDTNNIRAKEGIVSIVRHYPLLISESNRK